MFFDEKTLLKSMVINAMLDNIIYLCVETKRDAYKFFNISDNDDLVNLVTYVTMLQIDVVDFDIYIVSETEKIHIEAEQFNKMQLNNDVSTLDKILQAHGYEPIN